MSQYSSPLLIFIISFFLRLPPLSAASADETAAMLKLSKSLKVPGWTGKDPCKWKGVTCESSSGDVHKIDVRASSVSGTIAPEIKNLKNLKSLTLQDNAISGPIPSFSGMSSLLEIYLDSNSFSSVDTNNFCDGLTSLEILSFSKNSDLRPWTVPDKLSDCSALQKLDLSGTNLNGSLPDIFASLSSLESLRLSYNNFSGSLPPSLAGSSIQHLWINNCQFTGRIDVLGKMTNLLQAWLHVNKFTGPIPDLSNCTGLFDAEFRDNLLTGVIPYSLQSHQSLLNVSLGNNRLQGPFPAFSKRIKTSLGKSNNFCKPTPGPCDPQVTALLAVVADLGYPMILAENWKGNDPCKGWILISCDAGGKSVININFGKQRFAGTISPALANLTELVTIRLNDNNITGTIPESLTTLKHLTLLDVSNNNISGEVPTFRAGVKVQTDGNMLIGQDIDGGSSGTTGEETESGKSGKVLLIILIVLGAILVVLVGILFSIKKLHPNLWMVMTDRGDNYKDGTKNAKNTKKISEKSTYNLKEVVVVKSGSGITSTGSQLEDGTVRNIPIEVLLEITDNFDPDNIIGRGGFGVVYKGELPHDGTPVAIKRIFCSNPESSEGLRQFHSELSVLTTVRYRHLVAMLGYCVSENERFVIYEYMSQGTLEQHLFEPRIRGYQPLTWVQRVTIALDVARGIEYLHNYGPKNSFIHRDLKSSNILLGDDLRAKVSDFGLVKSTPDGNCSMQTKLAGTFGYLAPEYAATGRVTTKVDVFAFGAVLLEMITGRRALDSSMPDDRCHLVSWLRRYLIDKATIREHLREYLDASFSNLNEDTLESIYAVAELAGHCTAREPNQRPDMGYAVNILAPLVQKWIPSVTDKREEEDNKIDLSFSLSLPEALKRWQANEGNTYIYGTSKYFDTTNTTSQTKDDK